jgi:hypothetical protein
MARLYADEDFSSPVTERLRQLGYDILTAHEAGQAGQGIQDTSVLAFATAAGRVVKSGRPTVAKRDGILRDAPLVAHALWQRAGRA